MHPLIPLVLSFAVCLGLTPLVRATAVRRGWLANPTLDRWHKKPTALFGGVAIYAGFTLPVLIAVAADGALLSRFFQGFLGRSDAPPFAPVALAGASAMFFLGLLDDRFNIKPQTKLIGQILVASMVTFLGFRLNWFNSMTVDAVVTLFWIVGITNAFNLLDNMDGLCAGIGLISAAFLWLIHFGHSGQAALIALALAGSLAAFLVYNFNPASIFMGDSGSLTIGFLVAMLCLFHPQTRPDNLFSPYAVPLLMAMVPILDTTLVSAIRILSGRKASVGGRDHTSHRLILMGFSERKAVLVLYGAAAVSGVAAYFVSRSDALTTPAVFVPVLVSIFLLGIFLAQLRVYPEQEFSRLRGRKFTPVLIDLTYKRQILFVLLDFFLVAFAYYLSWRLRFDPVEFTRYFQVFLQSLPVVVSCKLLVFFIVGVYRGIWGRMSTNDILVHIRATVIATLVAIVLVTFLYRFKDFSKGVFVIDWLLTTAFLLGSRGSFRFFLDIWMRNSLTGEKVVIYGAGRGGELLLREIMNNSRLRVRPVGFIDDDPLKKGKKLHGFPILGAFRDMPAIAENHRLSGMLMSFRTDDEGVLTAAMAFCRSKKLFLKRFSIHLEDVDLPG